ncbi:MAG TPA: hypothetical protein VGR97_05420 [Candidatus Acidoferrales bacterium]|nr:hypothetical protein [Candidatus Acidoferrales bacterium]
MTELFRNKSLPYFPAVVLGCAFVLMPLGASAQNAPAGPMTPGTAADQTPATQTRTPAASPDAHPNLAGTWQLNKKQSDDPREKMREAWSEQGNEGGGGRWGGRRMGGGRRRQGQSGDMMKEFSQLTITQTASIAKVTGEPGRVLALYSSNTSDKSGTEEDSPTAQWQQNQLVVTTRTRVGSTTRSYELSPDGKQLYVTTRIENQRLSQPVAFRFVYDSIKSSE